MLTDLWTVTVKGWKDLFLYRGGIISTLVVLAAFGVVQPALGGPEFTRGPFLPLLLIWLPLFLAATMTADSFAGERERHTLETLLASRLSDRAILLGKLAAVVSYGWGVALASLSLGLITASLAHGHGRPLLPPANTLAVIVTMSLLTSLLAAGAGTLVSLRSPTVRQAQQILSTSLVVLIFGGTLIGRALPAAWKLRFVTALSGPQLVRTELALGAALLAADVVLLAACLATFHRARLILD